MIASLVVAGIRKAVVAGIHKALAADMDKVVVAGIRREAVAGVDTDNILGEAALTAESASLAAFHNYRKTLTRKQQGRRI